MGRALFQSPPGFFTNRASPEAWFFYGAAGRLLALLPGNGAPALDVGPHSDRQFLELRLIFRGQVGGFERVAFEIEKLPGLHRGVFDELPRATAHGPAGPAHIAEVSFAADPEEITLEGGLTSGLEKRKDGAAIDLRR